MAELTDYKRKFLVVVDETEECARAVTFAAFRVRRTGGTVVLLSVVEPDEFQHWLGVENIMRAEATEKAARLIEAQAGHIAAIGPLKVERVIREGRKLEALEQVIAEDKAIAILVLGASTSKEGPGPLVSAVVSRGVGAFPIPVTIVPGHMSDEEIEAIC